MMKIRLRFYSPASKCKQSQPRTQTNRIKRLLYVKTPIIFKSLNEVRKQNTFGNVKRDNSCRENTAEDLLLSPRYDRIWF